MRQELAKKIYIITDLVVTKNLEQNYYTYFIKERLKISEYTINLP